MPDLDEKIRNLGRGFCWMRPVDYGKDRELEMNVEVTDRGSVLKMSEYPLLHYDGETVWADPGQWLGAMQRWNPWVMDPGGRKRRRAQKRYQADLSRKQGTVNAVMNRCLPRHWRADLSRSELSFKASDRQAPLPLILDRGAGLTCIPVQGLLWAVELPPDFDLGRYHSLCPRPLDWRWSRCRQHLGDVYAKNLDWRTIRREFLVRKDVPPCPWLLPMHRNRTSPEEAK